MGPASPPRRPHAVAYLERATGLVCDWKDARRSGRQSEELQRSRCNTQPRSGEYTYGSSPSLALCAFTATGERRLRGMGPATCGVIPDAFRGLMDPPHHPHTIAYLERATGLEPATFSLGS